MMCSLDELMVDSIAQIQGRQNIKGGTLMGNGICPCVRFILPGAFSDV
jgi:hypothetical protein